MDGGGSSVSSTFKHCDAVHLLDWRESTKTFLAVTTFAVSASGNAKRLVVSFPTATTVSDSQPLSVIGPPGVVSYQQHPQSHPSSETTTIRRFHHPSPPLPIRSMPPERLRVEDVEIRHGYQPGLLTRTLEMQVGHYADTGMSTTLELECSLARNLGDMVSRLENANQSTQAWTAVLQGRIVGIIYIDNPTDDSKKVQLRSFMVDEEIRNQGVGRRLLTEAIAFTEQRGYPEIHVWTQQGLDMARRLYENFGFVLDHEAEGTYWGATMVVQRFVRKLGATKVAGNSTSLSS